MTRRSLWLPFALTALLVQCVSLYGPPTGPDLPSPAASDKLAHLVMFAVPAVLLVLAGVRRRVVVVGLVLQAGVSEVVQGVFLESRTGDPLDAVADLAGVAVGLLLTRSVGADEGG